MTDKTMPERMGVAETKIEDHAIRLDRLELTNENRKNWFIKQMLGLMKAIGVVTFLSFMAEMAKDGCKVCKAFMQYISGGGQ